MKRFLTVTLALLLSAGLFAQSLPSFSPYMQETYFKDKGLRSPQGAAIFGKYLFQFHDHNPAIAVYDLETKTLAGEISMMTCKTHHCNNVEFSNYYYKAGDEFPLVYVSMENIAEHCAIAYRITRDASGAFSAQQIQKIVFPEPVQMAAYYTNIYIDNDEGCFYVSGYTKNSWNKAEDGNALQMLKFRMPGLKKKSVILSTSDIIERRTYDFRVATQGGTIRNGKLFQVFGVPGYGPCSICCYDMATGAKCWEEDLAVAGIVYEPESLDIYDGKVFVVDVNGTVYASDYDVNQEIAVEKVTTAKAKEPVDFVNPYIGNISHLLVPTYPTIQLPNSLLRVYPHKDDYTAEYLEGFPIVITRHRSTSPLTLNFTQGEEAPVINTHYDNEVVTPYSYDVDIFDTDGHVSFAVSEQSAIYKANFTSSKGAKVTLSTRKGKVSVSGNAIRAIQPIDNGTTIYVYMESLQKPASVNTDNESWAAVRFNEPEVSLRYGVSLISVEQAEKNLRREIKDYNLSALAERGRRIWNETLGKVQVKGGTDSDKEVLYTSLYRNFERPVCISEDGLYFSAGDHQVHSDGGTPFYTDDWIWDTFRASHPLRAMLNRGVEEAVLESYLRAAEQTGDGWMPTFPGIAGDSRSMNCNHAIVSFADAIAKGLKVDVQRAYDISRKTMYEKTLIPWQGCGKTVLDDFYWENGYFPALAPGEKETVKEVTWENRQPVCVTLGTSYDSWALSRLAIAAGDLKGSQKYKEQSLFYNNLFKPDTKFFHPKDSKGNWIEPFDYSFCGGMGGREYYDENNGWEFRWEVQHDIEALVALFGGPETFCAELDRTFAEPLGRSKYAFFAKYPDHTGNVGQFSMANEPAMHVPFLYNHAGAAWKTQKRVRQMIDTWFRDDLMGIPGDEDGGGLTAFVFYSMIGFYPTTPGKAEYDICSPYFDRIELKTSSGKTFTIIAENASHTNKYIQSATLNGKPLTKAQIDDESVMNGGTLVLVLGDKPNKELFK